MSAAIKARILKDVKRRILAESSTYICFALDDIAALDHRRKVQSFCAELKQQVQADIAPYKTFGDQRLARGGIFTLRDVTDARLAWLDAAICRLECR